MLVNRVWLCGACRVWRPRRESTYRECPQCQQRMEKGIITTEVDDEPRDPEGLMGSEDAERL